MEIRKYIAILVFAIFTTNLSADLNFCETGEVDTRTLLSDFKILQKNLRDKLENSTSSEKRNIKETDEYKAMLKQKVILKCSKYQTKYNRYANDYYRNSKSNATIFHTIKYLNSVDNTSYLKYIISDLEKNQIADLSPIKWKGKDIFGLDIGFKKGRFRDFYIGFFYLENGEAKYEQKTAHHRYFQKDKRVEITNIGFGISYREIESKIALAFEIENALGKKKFKNPKSLEDYLAEKKISIFLDGEETTDIDFLSVKGISPKLDEVGFYLRDGKYTLKIRTHYQDDYQFEDGESEIEIDFPTDKEIRVERIKKPEYETESTNVPEQAKFKREKSLSENEEYPIEEKIYGNSPNSVKNELTKTKYYIDTENSHKNCEKKGFNTKKECETRAGEYKVNEKITCKCKEIK